MHVLTVGGATIDTIAIIESSRIERMTMLNADASFLLLAEGKKTEALEVSTHCGGGAVNSAVALSRLGHDVATLVKLGDDERATAVLGRLAQERVSTEWCKRAAGAATGASVFVASHERNAAIFTYRGSNGLMTASDIEAAAFRADLVHVASLSNRSADCFPLIAETAKGAGAFLSANPGIRQLSSRGDALRGCFGCIDLLAMNKSEAAVLVPSLVTVVGEGGAPLEIEDGAHTSALARRGLAYGGFHLGLRQLMRGVGALGVRHVLITDGADGAYLADANRVVYCQAAPAEVAGTAGAGDAFAATVASFLAEGRDAETALRAGAINAAGVVGFVDTQTGLLTRSALEKAMADVGPRLLTRTWPLQD